MMSTERLRQLARAGHIPKAEAGTYPLVEVVQGYLIFLQDDDRRSSKIAADRDLKSARQTEIETRIAARRRELIASSEVSEVLDAVVSMVDAEVVHLPARVEAGVPTRREIQKQLAVSLTRISEQRDAAKLALATGRGLFGALDASS
jgi:hypothetical protein